MLWGFGLSRFEDFGAFGIAVQAICSLERAR